MKNYLLKTVVASAALLSGVAVAAPVEKPNIVFIMADDLGPGWVDFAGTQSKIHTPNLERLAKSGMVFTQAYAGAPVCSPTRASCITGMSPGQVRYTTHAPGMGIERYLKGNGGLGKGGAVDAESIEYLPQDVPSYARELQKLGYATAFFGKWHLAGEGSLKAKDGILNSDWHPDHYGFDSNLGGCAYGQPKSWFSPFKNGTIPDTTPREYLTDRLGDEAAAYIRSQTGGPFHVALWLYSVHRPIKAPKELVAKNDGNAYLAMVESMDLAIGKMYAALEAIDALDNTMIVFYSDNGGDKATAGLAEKKGSLLEGGLRVPMAIQWPGVIPAASTCETPVISMDFFPTFVNAAGGDASLFPRVEGKDLRPIFKGADTFDREALYWHFPHHRKGIDYAMGSSVLLGDWKFYRGYGKTGDALFNLKDDPQEKRNVIAQHPEQASQLGEKLTKWLTKIDAKMPRTDADFNK